MGKVVYNEDLDPLEILEAQASSGPDAVALVWREEQLSYGELAKRVGWLAARLQLLKVQPEDVVGVCLGRGFDAVVGMLAVLKSGGVYLPLDPTNPTERLAYMIKNANAKIILANSETQHYFDLTKVDVALYPTEAADSSRTSSCPACKVERYESALTYVAYTSGSTGTPKGIGLTWQTLRNIIRFDLYRDRRSGLTPFTCLQLASLGFDVSLQEIFATLARGGRLVLLDEDTRLDTRRLLELLMSEGVERLHITPALLERLAATWADGCHSDTLPLTHICVGGDQIKLTPQMRRFLSASDNVVLENQYGPSETHHATTMILRGDQSNWADSPPIGRPISGVRIYVLDDHLRLVPPKVRGEVYIASQGLARGYLGQPGLTAAHFIADPFEAGSRMYRTGDVARWTFNGLLEFLGRADRQIKIRGFRVEPGEIEAALAAHPSVSSAAVVIHGKDPGSRHLVGYIVPMTSAGINAAELHQHLARIMPAHMLPVTYTPVAALPLNANGKLDQNALPDPAYQETSIAEPRSLSESMLCEIFSEILGIPHVGIYNSFFDLGGHSLLAPQLMDRIREAFHSDLPIRVLFDTPDVSGLAHVIDTGTSSQVMRGFQRLLPLRTGRDGTNLFCIHPGAGISWCYMPLPRLLRVDAAVYGLQDPSLLDADEKLASISEMAACYIRAIRQVQPNGPYNLLGWSFGGITAHEIAVQLQEQGERVGLLCMLDSYPPQESADDTDDALPSSHEREEVPARLRSIAGISIEINPDHAQSIHRSLANNIKLTHTFHPRKFHGDIIFFRAEHGWGNMHRTPEDWHPYVVGAVHNYQVECRHLDMMRPEPLHEIARIIGPLIGAQEEARPFTGTETA